MAWSKGSSGLNEPNEQINGERSALRSFALRLLGRPANSPNRLRGMGIQPNPNGGANTMAKRKLDLDLENFRSVAYETFRRTQIR